MSKPVYGKIMNYRIGIREQTSRECLIQFENMTSSAQAGQLLGKKVLWKSQTKKRTGKIIDFHGNNGAVRVRFKKGLPGQALGTTVELVG